MSDETRWVIGLGLPIVLALIAAIWTLLQRRIDRSETATEKALGEHRAALAKIETRFEQWIKDKERYDHEFRHDEYAPAIQRINLELYPLAKQVEMLDSELEKLREWKHLRGDPYVAAMDAMKQQIDRLELRMNSYLKGRGG